MDLCHSWIYEQVLNTEGFMWTIVYSVLGVNVFSPLIVWYFIEGKPLFAKARKSFKQQQR
ncbi:hypothetical protein [Cohnella yongneupensis]|uniref:Uncharacterized protein n=1 Tax=Cohnella yongneupensis TaxID=425006 RepID=A0ABW0R3T3_9BACL